MNTKLQKQVNSVMAVPLVMIFDGSHENAVSLETLVSDYDSKLWQHYLGILSVSKLG